MFMAARVAPQVAVAAACLYLCGAGAGAPPQRARERRQVATLQVALEAPGAAFFAQEPMVVRCSLRNPGDAALNMPRASEPPPLQFLVLTPEGEEVQMGSRDLKRAARSPRPVPRRNPPMDPQPGGATVRYTEDLNLVLPEALLPGKYLLQAIYQPSRVPLYSDRVPIEVRPPRHVAGAQTLDGTQRNLWTARVVPGAEGTGLLQKWSANFNAEPAPPAFRNLGPFPANAPLSAAVMAIETAGEGSSSDWRWLIWIDGANTLQGGRIRANDYKFPLTPARTPMPGARIEGPGFQLDDGRGIFLVAGSDGSRSLALLDPEGEVKWLTLGPAFSSRGVAQPTLWFQPVDEEEQQRPAELTITWFESRQLKAGTVDPLTGTAKRAPAVLYTALAPVVAWQAPPYPRPHDRRTIQIVVRPPVHPWLVELGFDGVESPAIPLPAPPEKIEATVRWVLPQRTVAEHPVAITAGGLAWWAFGGGFGPWHLLNSHPMDPASLRLWAIHNDATLAVWAEPGEGWAMRRLEK